MLIITVFNLNHGMECVSRQDLLVCKKGKTITLFSGKDIFTWMLMPKDNESEPKAAGTLHIGGKCGNVSKCAGHEGSNMVSKIYNILEEPHVFSIVTKLVRQNSAIGYM